MHNLEEGDDRELMVNESVALDSRANFTKDIATTVMIRHFVR